MGIPHFRHHFTPPLSDLFCSDIFQFLFAIIFRKGPFLETDELPRIFIKFRKIVDDLPLLGDALFRTLIVAGNARFS